MPKLRVITHIGRQAYTLGPLNTIGRNPDNHIRIAESSVSGNHCEILLGESGKAVIRDLGSSNGTYVNRRRIDGPMALQDGDDILIGGAHCLFYAEASEKAAEAVQLTQDEGDGRPIASQVAELAGEVFYKEADIADVTILREDYEKLRVTYELQRDIGLELDIDRILWKILERTHEFLHFDRGVVMLSDESGKLVPMAHKFSTAETTMAISSTLVQRVKEEKVGILSSDALSDNRFDGAHSIMIQGIRSTLAVPILHQAELLGVMLLDSLVHVNAYTEKDLHLLTNIANQTGQLIKNSQLAKKIEADAVTRERFQRLLSPNLAEMVVSGRLKVEKGGENRIATVLFADIRGFTSMSEHMPASDVLRMLNDYYEVVVEQVFQYEGTVDKFIGDGMMVIWGAPVKHDDDPDRAIHAALGMQSLIKLFNRSKPSKGYPRVEVGIGINTGPLVAGYIGSSQTMSYSVIGDAVNTAARICSAAKPGEILITEATRSAMRDRFEIEALEPVQVKGKAKPLCVYSVKSCLSQNS